MNRKEWIDYINKQLDNRAELLRKIHDLNIYMMISKKYMNDFRI